MATVTIFDDITLTQTFLAYSFPTTFTKNFLIIKPTRCTSFSNLFWKETLHVSDSSSVHH